MRTIVIAIAVALCAAVAVPATAHQGKGKNGSRHKPDVIALPNGFQPEGITTSKRHTFFVGSRATGAIYKGSLRSGQGEELVAGGDGKQATGLKVDRFGRLFVSGAGSDAIRVYDSRTGDEIRTYTVDAGFINDNVVTKQGVYFTDSQKQQLYFIPFGKQGALGDLVTIPITGDFVYTLNQFNANGIEAAKGGKTLILVSSHDGALYTADAATGATKRITVTGLDNELENGDGIMLKGRKLYVVENRDGVDEGVTEGTGEVSVVRLSRNLTSGTIVREISDERFDVPTTIARSGGRNYVVNAKFGSESPETDTYEVVKVPKK